MQIIALDDEVVIERWFLSFGGQGLLGVDDQLAEGDGEVVGINEGLAFEIKCRHARRVQFANILRQVLP